LVHRVFHIVGGVVAVGVHMMHRGVEEDVHRAVDNFGETGRFPGVGGVVGGTG
jgi:hypothetical protein